MTLKAHQIADHFEQYFDDPLVKQEGLGMCSDQIIEHMHSYIKRMMLKSRYHCSIADSAESAKRQHRGILRLVTFSVRKTKFQTVSIILVVHHIICSYTSGPPYDMLLHE